MSGLWNTTPVRDADARFQQSEMSYVYDIRRGALSRLSLLAESLEERKKSVSAIVTVAAKLWRRIQLLNQHMILDNVTELHDIVQELNSLRPEVQQKNIVISEIVKKLRELSATCPECASAYAEKEVPGK